MGGLSNLSRKDRCLRKKTREYSQKGGEAREKALLEKKKGGNGRAYRSLQSRTPSRRGKGIQKEKKNQTHGKKKKMAPSEGKEGDCEPLLMERSF